MDNVWTSGTGSTHMDSLAQQDFTASLESLVTLSRFSTNPIFSVISPYSIESVLSESLQESDLLSSGSTINGSLGQTTNIFNSMKGGQDRLRLVD